MATTGMNTAAVETTDVVMSYGLESQWGVAPATTFQAWRMTSESMAGKKTRSRPDEINDSAQVSAAVTTQEGADGAINFALSYGTFDDAFCSLLNSSWSNALNIVGVGGDITFVAQAGGNRITSTTANKFQNVVAGQYIKVMGCAAAPGGNGESFFVKVDSKTDNQTLVVSGKALVAENPAGAAVTIRGSMIRNSNVAQTLFIQKKLGAAGYLTYPGSFASGANIDCQQGQFTTGSINYIAKIENKALTDSSTGGVLPAPTGLVIDPVAGMQALTINGTAIAASIQSMKLQFQKEGAAAHYAMMSPGAVMITKGKLAVTGTTELYFANFTEYDRFKAESTAPISFRQVDAAGAAYVLTVLNAALMNPKITAGGPGRPVVASFELEGNPDPITGATFQMDRAA